MCDKLNKVKENIKGVNKFIVKLSTLEAAIEEMKEPSVLDLILDSIPAMVFYKDTGNRLLKVSQYLADSCGVKKEDLEGKHADELSNQDLADKYARNDHDVIESKKPKLNIIEPLFNNKGKMVRTDKFPIVVGDVVIGILGISVEIE